MWVIDQMDCIFWLMRSLIYDGLTCNSLICNSLTYNSLTCDSLTAFYLPITLAKRLQSWTWAFGFYFNFLLFIFEGFKGFLSANLLVFLFSFSARVKTFFIDRSVDFPFQYPFGSSCFSLTNMFLISRFSSSVSHWVRRFFIVDLMVSFFSVPHGARKIFTNLGGPVFSLYHFLETRFFQPLAYHLPTTHPTKARSTSASNYPTCSTKLKS